jgi:hypothetical protein
MSLNEHLRPDSSTSTAQDFRNETNDGETPRRGQDHPLPYLVAYCHADEDEIDSDRVNG